MKQFAALLLALAFFGVFADETFPKPDWKDDYDPIASRDAEIGGELVYYGGQTPKSFNYYLSTSTDASLYFGLMYDSLLGSNPVTLDDEPAIASKWSISDDKKVFTFQIDPNARWSDGKAISAHDVKWTLDEIRKPESLTGPWKLTAERFSSVEVIDDSTVRFTAKDVHWSLLNNAGGFPILPKHVFEGKEFAKINFEFPVVSGPYMIEEHKTNRYLRMKRRDDWWGWRYKRNQNKLNFEHIRFKFYETADTAFEAFGKGEFDVYSVHKAAIWVKSTSSEKFKMNWIIKQKVSNYDPIGFQGWVMNMRKAPFDDIRVRRALYHLIDRETMNKTMMHSQYFLHKSFYEDLYTDKNPCPNELIKFDVAKARKLLNEAGWKANPDTGLLEKDGKAFEINFLTRSPDTDRFLVVFKQALKDVGISLKITRKDWSSWMKDMDTFDFQMTWAAWGAGVRKDPEYQWHSKEGKRTGGNNVAGFESEEVDKLIAKQKTIFDINVRHDIVKKIDQLVYKEFPYALLWNIDYARLLYWNKFGTPPTVLSKYGDAASSIYYWWSDIDAVDDLDAAQKDGKPLPKRPQEIEFDKEFSPRN